MRTAADENMAPGELAFARTVVLERETTIAMQEPACPPLHGYRSIWIRLILASLAVAPPD
jgi:hypothetical protein